MANSDMADMANATLDLDFVRAQFPAFEDPETAAWAHLENAGGSYVPRQVIGRLDRFMRATRVQPHAPFGPSAAAGEAMDESHAWFAEMLGIGQDEFTLGPSTTANFYVLAQAMKGFLRPGDEVVVTNQDHEANIGAWRRLADHGCVIREWRIDPESGALDPAGLEALLTDRTRLVCFTHCSNIVGSVTPAADLSRLAREAGAVVVVDGVSYAPHALPDFAAIGADVYAFSLYKTFGPHLGALHVKRELLPRLANQCHYFKASELSVANRLNPAGPNHAEIAAAGGVCEYYDALHAHHFSADEPDRRRRARMVFDLFAAREEEVARRVLDFLKDRPGVRLYGSRDADRAARAPTITFSTDRMSSRDVVRAVLPLRVGIRNGSFYAARCVSALGLDPEDGVVRVSAVHYNSDEEIDRLLEGLDSVL